MTKLVRIGADCEAFGHPSECSEPAPGTVERTSDHSVTITNGGGDTKNIATVASADMKFPSHGHSTDDDDNCTDFSSHTLDPSTTSSSVKINGSPVYIKKDSVASDPISGGQIDIINAGGNNSVDESP